MKSEYSIQSLQEGDEEIEFYIHNKNYEMIVSESDNEMTVFSQLNNGST